jgi:hypothetical protein
MKEHRRVKVWSRSSVIRSSVLKFCLQRRSSVEGMISQCIGVLKFRLQLMKLSQVLKRPDLVGVKLLYFLVLVPGSTC